jgi:hypothetical protein
MSCLREWNYISVPSIMQKISIHATPMVLGEKTLVPQDEKTFQQYYRER